MKIKFLYILIFFNSSIQLSGQVSYGGKPYPYKEKKVTREWAKMPLFNYNWVLAEMESDERQERRKPLPVAWNYEVNLSPFNSGSWEEYNDGVRVWRMEVFSENAYAISVYFDEFKLLPGSRIFLYDPSQQHILGSYDHRSNKAAGNLPVSYIPGDKLIVELQVDKGVFDFGSLRIGSVSHAFVPVFGESQKKDAYFGRSGSCNIDINCPSGDNWQDVKNAVCRIIFKRNAGSGISELCTGTLVNNTSREKTNYILTANHCIDKESAAQSAVFYFEYESSECNGSDGMINQTLSSSGLLSTSDSLDFSLLLLDEAIPDSYNTYYAGWTASSVPSTSSVCIHHPMGDVKKISTDRDPVTAQVQAVNPPTWLKASIENAFWRVIRWEEGTTEGGSSGSPLFNPDKQIVGNLTGGDATCNNPVNDYFSKFHFCWDYYQDSTKQLKYWLDKENTGLTSIGGFDPSYYPDSSKTIFEIIEYFNDMNELSIFKSLVLKNNLDVKLSGGGSFTVFAPLDNVFNDLSANSLELLLSGQTDRASEIINYHIVNEKFKAVELLNGMELISSSNHPMQVSRIEGDIYIDYARILIPDIIASNGVIHLIDAVLFPLGEISGTITLFPNPSSEELWLSSLDLSMKGARLRIYNTNGQVIRSIMVQDDNFSQIIVSDLSAGIYIVELTGQNIHFMHKLVIVKPRR